MAATSTVEAASKKSGTFGGELRQTCTHQKTRVCRLLRHLSECNEILWHAGLQLKEDTRDDLGDVSIAMVPVLCRGFQCCRSPDHDEEAAVRLMCCLLTVHRCIVSVEVNYCVAKNSSLLGSLASSSSVRRLSIFGIPRDEPGALQGLANVIASLDLISELVFLDGYEACEAKMAIPARLLQLPSARVSKLDVADLEMSPHMARKLIEALISNGTITELAVGACVFTSGPTNRPSEWFALYLAKENATLRKLVLRARHFNNTFGLRTLTESISAMKTLEDLVAQWYARSRDCSMFSTVVRASRSLRSLSLRLAGCCSEPIPQYRARGIETLNVRPWLSALKENNALKKLVLDIPWSSTEDCCALIRELPSNDCLQKLVLRSLPDDGGLREICGIIRDCGIGHRVYIEDHHVGPEDVPALSDSQELTAVMVSSRHFGQDVASLRSAFQVLTSCKHVTSLSARCHNFTKDLYASLTACIKGATTLKEIYLDIEVDGLRGERDESVIRSSMLDLFRGLSSNLSITKITLEWTVLLGDDHSRVLADAVLTNRRLYELSIRVIDDAFCASILSHLDPGLAQNYSILHLELPINPQCGAEIAAAQNIVRRNCSLVNRATRFVMGVHEPYCARAVELVSVHPKLVDNVRREANVTGESEAVAIIRRALRLPCLTDMCEFMKLAGVVKNRVQCHVRQDGSRQLDQLNHDCWLHIRQFLKVADVADP
ncbi:hypothetical protein HPB49_014644 [Dermacentor silvarum]|uniref:Uncharacterized protein n=1 Tax=Dermacentor silvarum TaxID=543639 RepID=A0ACB8CRK1_DERSI|nr:uncharacterized protein LOC125945281 [Dermacentor silvarum]KAH7949729.1 hypothetical protein HPB49_014644 [Dermacentor silvarum]